MAYQKIIIDILSWWTNICLFPVLFVAKVTGHKEKMVQKLMILICGKLEKQIGCYLSFLYREKYPDSRPGMKQGMNKEKIGIVMQGPLIRENNFTVNTIKRYMNYSDNLSIIVSTWDDEDRAELDQIRAAGAVVVTSKKPEFAGNFNINYQLVSTLAGIKKAVEFDCKYICKTRTDQRIYGETAFAFMMCLLKHYPAAAGGQRQRLIGLSTEYGSMYKPYYISDFLYFGQTEDIYKLFDIPLDERNIVRRKNSCQRAVEDELIPEVYILREYLKKTGAEYGVSVKDYWLFLRDRMILIDKSIIGLYWPKYESRYCEHMRNGSYSTAHAHISGFNFDFASWLCLYNGDLLYKEEYEKYLDLLM
jgi:hypothetical protein